MASLPIVTGADNPILRGANEPVAKATKEVLKLIKDMEDTVQAADGMGLAAPQVGQNIQLCLVRVNNRLIPLLNPKILHKSPDIEIAEEGCLSLPNMWLQIPRAVSIVVRYQDIHGETQERMLEGMEARIVQHEVEHLEGKLIVDYAMRGKAL